MARPFAEPMLSRLRSGAKLRVGGLGSREPKPRHSAPGCPSPFPRNALRRRGVKAPASRQGPPSPRMANPHNGFYELFRDDDVAEMVEDAALPLAPSAAPNSVIDKINEAFGGAIGTFLALQNGTGASFGDVREWLGGVEKDAAALLARLGCDPAWVETVEQHGSEVFGDDWDLMGINELAPYYLHLSRSHKGDPPFLLRSVSFRDGLCPASDCAPDDAVLRAIPECLAVLMICARQNRADYAQPVGRKADQFRRVLFQRLASAHLFAFDRKPITRDNGTRAGTGALWVRSLCEKAAKRAATIPGNSTSAVVGALTAVAEAADATLFDDLDDGWKACCGTQVEPSKLAPNEDHSNDVP